MAATILIVDDEPEICAVIELYLAADGYAVASTHTVAAALAVLEQRTVDLIILDVMLPDMTGLEACQVIRRARQMPIIMLSAKWQDLDKIHGLTTGADDYMTKPFNPLELVARVKAQLRRYFQFGSPPPHHQHQIVIDDLVINTAAHTVSVEGRDIALTPTEFTILSVLARHRGSVLSAERIYELAWESPAWESNNTVMVHIRNLRAKLERDPRQPRYIKTVWGVGYSLGR